MASTVTIFSFEIRPDGYVEVNFLVDGQGPYGLVWSSVEEMKSHVLDPMSAPEEAIRWPLRWWFARDADFSNPALIVGKDMNVDFSKPNPITVG